MASALYTPAILDLATGLADYPIDTALPLSGAARSKSCGSTLTMRLALDRDGTIARVGIAAHACAIGQASAMIFAQAARGRTAGDIAAMERAIASWLRGEQALPDWPGLTAIAPAAAYPGRHGAVLLGWQAALSALSSLDNTG